MTEQNDIIREDIRLNKDIGSKRAAKHKGSRTKERDISDFYPEIDNDLARDNIENDLSSADLQDL